MTTIFVLLDDSKKWRKQYRGVSPKTLGQMEQAKHIYS